MKYTGPVNGGKFKPEFKDWFLDSVKKIGDGSVEITIDKVGENITSNQRNYFFGVIVDLLHKAFKDLGNQCDKSNILDYIKDKWLFRETFNPITNSLIKTYISLSDSSGAMTKKEFTEKKEQIQEFAATILNVVIPDPLPEYKMFKDERK